MSELTAEQKRDWMAIWCAKNHAQLSLDGSCGFGRECVGILVGDNYPDYYWHDSKTYERADNNGRVWTPEDAYHKCDCVAVLGRGDEAEDQLYRWLKWFDENDFTAEEVAAPPSEYAHLGVVGILLGKHRHVRMVKRVQAQPAPTIPDALRRTDDDALPASLYGLTAPAPDYSPSTAPAPEPAPAFSSGGGGDYGGGGASASWSDSSSSGSDSGSSSSSDSGSASSD